MPICIRLISKYIALKVRLIFHHVIWAHVARRLKELLPRLVVWHARLLFCPAAETIVTALCLQGPVQ